MTHEVLLSLADPDAEVVETDHGVWAVSALDAADLCRLIAGADRPAEVRERIVGRAEDAVVVGVSERRPQGVYAYRSPTGTREVYYLRASDGTTLLTDQFRNALAALDPADRRVPRAAVADHLLFRSPVEPLTYLDRVRALGQGEWLRWDGSDDGWTVDLVDRLGPGTPVAPGEEADRVDGVLAAVLARGGRDDARCMLSGGVDSTLLASYLDEPRPFVMGVDSPEFAFELEYADRACSLLDAAADRRVVLPESGFLDHLEDSVDALGYPSHYNQTVLTDAAFRAAGPGQYVNGEGADALFGLTGTSGYRVADRLDPVLSGWLAERLPDRLPGVADAYRALARLAGRLDRPPADPDSAAGRLAFYTDPAAAADLVGELLVADRFRRQAASVRRRVPVPDGGRFARQAAFGHLLSYLRHDTACQWRQLGHVHGQSLFAPFAARSLARAALAIPADRRYVRGLPGRGSPTTKPHLRSLVEARLPGYETGRPKGSGSLPVGRYLRDGPLAGVFERYPPPSFVGRDGRDRHVDAPGPLTWPLLTFAVWRDRVLRSAGASPVDGTRRVRRRLRAAPPVP